MLYFEQTTVHQQYTKAPMILCSTIVFSILLFSLIEWYLHKEIMHKPFTIFGYTLRYPFKAHAQTHHVIFKADDTYHLQRDADKWTIPMAWWNGFVLVTLATLPMIALKFILGTSWSMPIVYWLTGYGYYLTYEYIHWCMHLPLKQRRVIERFFIFYRLNGHHLLHHRWQNTNFNVVLPFWDLVLGTLLIRSKFRFAQATGPSVPDVQPRN